MTVIVAVELEGKLTAGTTVVDYAQQTGLPHNAKVLHTINREKFVAQFFNAVKKMSVKLVGINNVV